METGEYARRFHANAPKTQSSSFGVLSRSLPTSPPAPSPSAAATNEPDDQQQDHRADGGVNDCRNKTGAKLDAELGKQPASEEGARYPNDNIPEETKSGTLYDLSGEPSSNETDHEYNEKTFT
jgi:hypothetical protein